MEYEEKLAFFESVKGLYMVHTTKEGPHNVPFNILRFEPMKEVYCIYCQTFEGRNCANAQLSGPFSDYWSIEDIRKMLDEGALIRAS